MPQVTIYHNPRCSKSRETLKLITDRALEPRVIKYLDDPLDERAIRQLVDQLGIHPIDMIRRKEKVYQQLNLDQHRDDADALIRAMVQHPILIERPIVTVDGQARIGRPPQRILEILPSD